MRTITNYKQKLKSQRSVKEKLAIQQWLGLRKVSPDEWVKRVNNLPEHCRATVARMIWWDFWSNKMVSGRWTHFDEYLKFDHNEESNPVDTKTLENCLSSVGYPDYRVKLRLMAFQNIGESQINQ